MNIANVKHAPDYTIFGVSDDPNSRQRRKPATEPDRQEVASYVADMILELRNMAKSAQLYKVMVPLEFAYYEAFNAANQVEIPNEEIERLRQLSEIGDALDAAGRDPAEAKAG